MRNLFYKLWSREAFYIEAYVFIFDQGQVFEPEPEPQLIPHLHAKDAKQRFEISIAVTCLFNLSFETINTFLSLHI